MKKYSFDILPMNLDQAGQISSFIKKLLNERNIDKIVIRRVSIATYEAEINVVIHSYGGKCLIDMSDDKIEIEFKDTGPGIDNIEKAMSEGWSTASAFARENGFGAGMGLPNMKKVADEFNITSSKKGTIVKFLFKL